jgi:hypothetical protein
MEGNVGLSRGRVVVLAAVVVAAGGLTAGVVGGTSDSATQTAVKAAAVSDLHADLYAMRQPQTASGQRLARFASQGDTVTDMASMDAALMVQAQGASSAWASDAAAAQVTARYRDASEAYADPDYVGYDDGRTVVDTWQSVRVTSSTKATVVFVGHDSFKTVTGWHDEEREQFELRLKQENGRWLVESRLERGLVHGDPTND